MPVGMMGMMGRRRRMARMGPGGADRMNVDRRGVVAKTTRRCFFRLGQGRDKNRLQKTFIQPQPPSDRGIHGGGGHSLRCGAAGGVGVLRCVGPILPSRNGGRSPMGSMSGTPTAVSLRGGGGGGRRRGRRRRWALWFRGRPPPLPLPLWRDLRHGRPARFFSVLFPWPRDRVGGNGGGGGGGWKGKGGGRTQEGGVQSKRNTTGRMKAIVWHGGEKGVEPGFHIHPQRHLCRRGRGRTPPKRW